MKDKNYLIQNGVDVEKSLELFGDMEMYNESIKDFLTDASSKLDKLRDFKAKGDMADMFYISEHFDELEQETIKAINITKVYLGQEENINTITSPNNQINSLNETILVVDDSEVIRNFIKKIFSNKYNVLIANNGLKALEIITNNTTKIIGILLDLNMPEFNGFQFLNYFKQNNLFEKIPVSIITGVGSDELVSKAYEYPIIDVLRKPFNENDIKIIVEKTVSNYKE